MNELKLIALTGGIGSGKSTALKIIADLGYKTFSSDQIVLELYRQIEGTVKKILAYRDLNDMPLDLPNISRAIDDMFKNENSALPTPGLIISQVCKFYSVDESVLRGPLKNKGTSEARHVAIYLIRKLTNLSLPDIGKEFAKDHSTVLYNIRKVEMALKKGDTIMQNNIRDITANINSCL